ncbi:MAG: TonB-dependent receptor, partial [Parvibaculaceae bacterium]|nr:TonB-dependent receptor [Parvibaculaceae bacterium]
IRLSTTSVLDGALVSTDQEVFGTILKAELQVNDDIEASIGWVHNHSKFAHGSYDYAGVLHENTQDVVNNTLTGNLDWNPGSDLINLNARLWYTHLENAEVRAVTVVNDNAQPVNYSLGTLGASVDNTSEFATPFGALSVNYGAEAFWDRGQTSSDTFYNDDGEDFTTSYTGATPSGNRYVYSAFANGTLDHDDWLTLSAGLRYDYYQLSGSTSIYSRETTTVTTCRRYNTDGSCRTWRTSRIYTYPKADLDINKSKGALLPTVMVAVKPFDWLQPFAKYSRSMRPPSIMETFLSGGHPGLGISEYAPNPDLNAETGDTFEIGANITRYGLFTEKDSFRFKAVGFYRLINDYISLGEIYRPETDYDYTSYVNVDGVTRMKGVEIEASYDMGLWYAGLSYTHLKTDFGDTYTYNGTSADVSPAIIFTPPTDKLTLDTGVRLFDEKLTLSGKMNHVGGTSPNIGQLVAGYVTEDYTLYDLYGSFKLNENATMRAALNNLTDVAYIPAMGSTGAPAPGRTATVSLSLRF